MIHFVGIIKALIATQAAKLTLLTVRQNLGNSGYRAKLSLETERPQIINFSFCVPVDNMGLFVHNTIQIPFYLPLSFCLDRFVFQISSFKKRL